MAGMIGRGSLLRCVSYFKTFRPKTTYVVLLPENPVDTEESNALLRTEALPQFDQLTAEKCWTGVGKLALEYESGVWALEDIIKDSKDSVTFDNVIGELDKLVSPLNTAWSTVKTLYTVKNNEMNSSSYLKIHERARKARAQKFQSRTIYEACKSIYHKSDLDEAQKRVVRKFLLEARLNGIDLPPEKASAFITTLTKLESQKTEFKRKVIESTNRFSYPIHDPVIVRDFPDSLLKSIAIDGSHYKQGPWAVTLQPHIYHSFLEHCPLTDVRRNTYRAYNMRASSHVSQDLNNSLHIEEIRSHRGEQARLLGYESFGRMSMETKMAGSLENVHSMITSILAKAKKSQEKEISSLQEFAESRNFDLQLEEWDVPYWRRKQKRHLFNFDDMHLSEYFPLEHVLESLLHLCSELFGITFEEIGGNDISTWHPDVRFFNVLDTKTEEYLASFYFDPFQRPGEKLQTRLDSAWSLGLRSRSIAASSLPVSNLVFNFTPPASEEVPALLTFAEVNLLFQKFGSALQHLLTTVPYSEASGLTNIEWDAVEVCSYFLQNWLYEPAVLQRVSQHYDSGLPLSGSSIQELLASHKHMGGYDLCTELYFSHLDIELYTRKEYWLDIAKELWPVYRPFEMDKYDSHLCSNTTIMADVWGAAYYSHLWSRMVAADAFQAFKDSNESLSEVGSRFRSTFLALGGGCHPSEVFRSFRGRDPSPDALHQLYGLTTSSQ